MTGTNALNSIVSVTESALPAGITASLPNFQFIVQPSIVTPTQTVTFDITGSVATGSYPVTFTASAVNGPTHPVTIALVVPGFSSAPNFSLSVTPGSINIPYGTGQGSEFNSSGGLTVGSAGSVPLTISVVPQNGFADCVTVAFGVSQGGPYMPGADMIGNTLGALAIQPGTPQTMYVGGYGSTGVPPVVQYTPPGTYTATFTAYDSGPAGTLPQCGTVPVGIGVSGIAQPLSHAATVSITILPSAPATGDFTLA